MISIVLLAGASGSGKSRVARLTGSPRIALDDFYLDGDHPDLPHAPSSGWGTGIVDWDDVRSWDLDAALAALTEVSRRGVVDLPVYAIAENARTGHQHLDARGSTVVVAEGIFAPDLIEPCRAAGLPVTAIWLDRPRTVTAVLRFVRDVGEARKPVGVLLRRGLALWRTEPEQRARAIAAGCRPLSIRATRALITQRLLR